MAVDLTSLTMAVGYTDNGYQFGSVNLDPLLLAVNLALLTWLMLAVDLPLLTLLMMAVDVPPMMEAADFALMMVWLQANGSANDGSTNDGSAHVC